MVDDAVARRERPATVRLPHALWPVVLAAGAGRRLASVTGGAPKQFWRPSGSGRSLLEDTLARVSGLHPSAQISVIVDAAHESYVGGVSRQWGETRWIFQPRDCGTAAGVLLALTPVLDVAPDQMVLVTPSDHGIVDAQAFRESAFDAADAVGRGLADVILFGMPPVSSCPDYGWIIPGALYPGRGRRMRRVIGFKEKPAAEEVPQLIARHALWSTMVLVARASTLRRLYNEHLQGVAALFAEYWSLPAASRSPFLTAAYATLHASDFSRDILAHTDGLAVHVWPASIGWADLGTPDRLQEWMRQSAKRGTHNAA